MVIGKQSTKPVMGMDDIRMKVTEGFLQPRYLTQVSSDTLSIHAEIPAFDALLFNGINLLRNEWSVFAILAASDD